MPLLILVGQTGTFRFLPELAGLDAALIQGCTWQMQGAPAACEFIAPDQCKGLAVGVQNFRVKTTLVGGEGQTYRFEVQCVEPGPPPMPKVVPVALSVTT